MPGHLSYRTIVTAFVLSVVLCLSAPGSAHALHRAPGGAAWTTESPPADQRLELPACFAVDCSTRELELFDDLHDRLLDRHRLLTAALVACGVADEVSLDRYQAMFDQFVQRRLAEGCAELPPAARAAALLESLHRELLSGGYDRGCTHLAAAFDAGRFNCVSATILWQCLAERFELQSIAAELPGHMNAHLRLGEQLVEVETTCPRWFSLGHDQASRRQAVEQVRSGPSADTDAPRPLDAASMIAAIYYNRGIDLLEASRHAEAVAANAKAHQLDPASAVARCNLLASVNNWALWLAAQQQHGRACQLLAAARGMAPDHEPFQVNYVAVHQQWIDALAASSQWEEASALADRLSMEMPEQPFFRRIRDEIDRRGGNL